MTINVFPNDHAGRQVDGYGRHGFGRPAPRERDAPVHLLRAGAQTGAGRPLPAEILGAKG